MQIRFDYPPNFAAIDAKFNVAGKPVIFAWGDAIYNPKSICILPDLIAHENVHGERQTRGIIAGDCWDDTIRYWWRRYIEDDDFRLREEVIAHRMEMIVRLSRLPRGDERKARLIRAETAQRLANPIYQYGISVKWAAALLRGEA